MRRFWFVVSLILVFVFTASASYIYFALADSPKEVDEPYMALGTPVTHLAAEVKTVLPDVQLTIRDTDPACGHTQEEGGTAAESDMLGLAFDELALAGWSVAQIGEQRLLLEREQEGLCPEEAAQRLLCQTERGLAVYEGNLQHTGQLLLEMPVGSLSAELPPDFLASLAAGGYQLASQCEL
ncbi:MAG: hypothetical protein OSJ64_08810, partial [Firmicutes bacterium]|nr:hypothetical protein [Bacillota bacterium]